MKVPYIEKENGNIYARKAMFKEAIIHYNKSLFSLKCLFDKESGLITEEEQAVKLIREIELPVCLNLALCYNKTEQWHYTIKYASQALEKEPQSSKALFRRG